MRRLRAGLIALVLGLGSAGAHSQPTSAVDPGGNCNDAPCYTLTVNLTGSGSGSWQSTNSSHVPDGNIDCRLLNGVKTNGSICSHEYGGTPRVTPITVHFTLTPAFGSEACYAGDCSDSFSADYVLGLSVTVNSQFELLSYPLTVSTGGTGKGSVFSTPTGILCGINCSITPLYGSQWLLTAVPEQGSSFSGWTGACTGQPADCLIAVIGNTTTQALFSLPASPPPSPAATLRPTGTRAPGSTAPPAGASPSPGASVAGPLESGASPPPPASGAVGDSPAASVASSSTTAIPVQPAATTTDLTPIVLAILVAGLLLAIGVAAAGFALQRRRGAPRS